MVDKPKIVLSPAVTGKPLTAAQIAERNMARRAQATGAVDVLPVPIVDNQTGMLVQRDARGKQISSERTVRAHFRKYITEATTAVADMMNDHDAPASVRLQAAKLLLAYGAGLPIKTQITATPKDVEAMQRAIEKTIEVDDRRLKELEIAAGINNDTDDE